MEKINVAGPSITEKEISYVTDAITNGWYENAFGYIGRFEEDFKNYVGRKYALAMPSCTSSIHIALLALGIQAGDEVIVSDITWIATASPIKYVGATPVFADIDNNSWCISLESIKKCVTPKTKAIIVVDLYGNMPEMDEILTFAKNNNIYVIEDSAQALGSEYKGQKAGSFGDFSVFSFHGTKILTTGEGGMLLTDDEILFKRSLKLRDLGRSDNGKMFWNDEVAQKYKMSNLQAALGLAQLHRFDEILKFKIQTFRWYEEELKNIQGLMLNCVPSYNKSNYWMNTVMWDKNNYSIEKEEVMKQMKEKFSIDTRPFFYPLSSLPAYEEFKERNYKYKNPISYELTNYAINLPSAMNLNYSKVKKITECFLSILH